MCGTSCLDPSEVGQGGEARDDERENMTSAARGGQRRMKLENATSAARDFEKILFVMTNGIPMHRFSRIVT